MRLLCDGQSLVDAANKVSKATSARGVIPVLEGIKIEAKNNTVVMTATDLEIAIQKTIVADVKQEGVVVVPGKLFCDFVKRLSIYEMDITVDANNKMHIKYQDSVGQIACYDAKDFPDIRKMQSPKAVSVIRSDFKDIVNKVAFCCSTDDSRPILKGVLLEIENDITGVALDGYRLAKCTKPIAGEVEKIKAVVPSRSIQEIDRLVEDTIEPLQLYFEKNYIKVDLGHTVVIAQLLDGEFIEYKRIIPAEFETKVVVSREGLNDALERASTIMQSEKTSLIRYNITANCMEVSSLSERGQLNERLAVKLEGVEINIAFNARYYLDLLKKIGAQNISINIVNASSPAVVVPSAEDGVMFLVLPVRTT